jgi:hypothetical protein
MKVQHVQPLLTSLPIDLLCDIIAFILYSMVIHNISLVNNYFYSFITGDYDESITSDIDDLAVTHINKIIRDNCGIQFVNISIYR